MSFPIFIHFSMVWMLRVGKLKDNVGRDTVDDISFHDNEHDCEHDCLLRMLTLARTVSLI